MLFWVSSKFIDKSEYWPTNIYFDELMWYINILYSCSGYIIA